MIKKKNWNDNQRNLDLFWLVAYCYLKTYTGIYSVLWQINSWIMQQTDLWNILSLRTAVICICLQYLASSGGNVQWSEFQQGINFYGYVLYQSLQHKNYQVGQVLTSSSSRCSILLGRKEEQSCQNSCSLTWAFSFIGFCNVFNKFPLSTLIHLLKSRPN